MFPTGSIIVSAFPACGKSYLHEVAEKYNFTTSDSDSYQFSWVLDEDGKSTGVRNPDFPTNYIKHIKVLLKGKVNFIMVSSHDDVRSALEDAGLEYLIVHPQKDSKDEWLNRMKLRGNPAKFLNLIESNWEDWNCVMNLRKKWKPISGLFLERGEYLSDKVFCIGAVFT